MKETDVCTIRRTGMVSMFVLILLFAAPLSGQFSLISTSPSHGTTGVDTLATLSLTFNAPVDTTARFAYPGEFFLSLFFFPDSLVGEPDTITLSSDLKTVTIQGLHLAPETNYLFVIVDGVSLAGDSLDQPYPFLISTGPALPNGMVSGAVNYPGSSAEGSMVFFFERNPLEPGGGGTIRNGAVVGGSSGSYSADFMPGGTYWLVALQNFAIDETGEFAFIPGSAIGFYDPDGDAAPDSIIVPPGGQLSGINITLGSMDAVYARHNFPAILTLAHAWAGDAYPVAVYGDVEAEGNSYYWEYWFYSPLSAHFRSWVSFGEVVLQALSDSTLSTTLPLQQGWVDSDVAMAAAEAAGGSAYRSNNQDVSSDAALLRWYWGQPVKTIWLITYYSSTSAPLQLIIDALSGTPVGLEGAKPEMLPKEVALYPNYPNPFNPATTIRFALPEAMEVTAGIYNIAGQLVRTLFTGRRTAGVHSLMWDGTDDNGQPLASGIYLCRLQAGTHSAVRKMVLVR